MGLPKTANLESGRPSRGRHASKRALIAAYLVGLAVFPQLMTLGFSSGPALAGEAVLEKGEAGRFQPIAWEALAGFAYDSEIPGMGEAASKEEIARRSKEIVPQRVRALDGKNIALRGYVIPTDMEGNLVRSFILSAKNEIGCCFGDGLAMNQWVAVEVPKGQEFECDPLELATVLGKLEVGEQVEDGYVMSLYRMAAQKIRKG
jgi:hypothetical protein